MAYRIGVDIGGSFTDFAVLDDSDGRLRALKVFSRQDQPGQEVLEGMRQLESRYGIPAAEIAYFTHGTTVGVNTVIQRKGLRLGLLTTEGFVDVLELARLKIPNMYDLFSRRPTPLIPRERAFPIVGRIDADGNEFTPLDRDSVIGALQAAQAADCEGVVVSLLHSYRNPQHERAVKDIAAVVTPDLPIFLSSDIWPIIREYERTITATVSGYVQPRVAHYIGALQQALRDVGVTPEPRITKSNGGVMSAEQGKSDCVQMILSGTASGVIGAAFVARAAGIDKALSIDIGGTSADIALIIDGQPQYGIGETIGEFQIHIPSVSVSSIGHGGGSIARVDEFGVLKVGPESAGSNPGPVCFGKGGTRPTVTDSFAACGLIGVADLGYSAVRVDRHAARDSIQPLAARLGTTIEATAEAMQRISVSGMYGGVSALVSRFGIDPREFTLVAFGGAGPMLAPFLARALGMAHVLVPPTPGVLSALGGLVADIKNDFIRTVYLALEPGAEEPIRNGFADLEQRARHWLFVEQGYAGEADIQYSADMRYAGQSFEVETPLCAGAVTGGDLAAMAEAFHLKHDQMFGHCDRKAAVQLINLRLVIGGPTPKPVLPEVPAADGPPAVFRTVEAWIDGEMREVPFYRRQDLLFGARLDGPAVIAQDDCTTVLPPACTLAVDRTGNLRITIATKDDMP